MKGKNRYFNTDFWTDPYVMRLDPSEKLLYCYLFTNDRQNIAGVYEMARKKMANETGFDRDVIEVILQRFVKDGKIQLIEDWIIVFNTIKNQKANPNIVKGMQLILSDLPPIVKATEAFERLRKALDNINTNTNININENTNFNEALALASESLEETDKEKTALERYAENPKMLYEAYWRRNASQIEIKEAAALIEKYGVEKVRFAFHEAMNYGKCSLAYCRKILLNKFQQENVAVFDAENKKRKEEELKAAGELRKKAAAEDAEYLRKLWLRVKSLKVLKAKASGIKEIEEALAAGRIISAVSLIDALEETVKHKLFKGE